MVGGGSDRRGPDSTRAVPSMVQKLSHSSSKVWLQVGQRFISFVSRQWSVVNSRLVSRSVAPTHIQESNQRATDNGLWKTDKFQTISSRLKKYAISLAAFSSESDPCVAFSPTEAPNCFRIVPSSALAG